MKDKIIEIEREISKLDALSNIMSESPEEKTAYIGILISDIVNKVFTLLKSLQNQ